MQIYKYLFAVCRKHTREVLAWAELEGANDIGDWPTGGYPTPRMYSQLKKITGIEVDGMNNYVEWIKV